MSVVPVQVNADGSIDVIHDDAPGGSHSGTVTAAALAAAQPTPPNHGTMALPCPVVGCGSVSTHPIGGGAAPAAVQEFFVRVVARVGCACGKVTAGKPLALAQAHIKLEAEKMDGVGRWMAGTVR